MGQAKDVGVGVRGTGNGGETRSADTSKVAYISKGATRRHIFKVVSLVTLGFLTPYLNNRLVMTTRSFGFRFRFRFSIHHICIYIYMVIDISTFIYTRLYIHD